MEIPSGRQTVLKKLQQRKLTTTFHPSMPKENLLYDLQEFFKQFYVDQIQLYR